MTDLATDIFRAERERRCDKALKLLADIEWTSPAEAEKVGRLRALIELLRENSDMKSVDLRDVACGLDQTAVESIQAGELVKAREAIALAITLDDRQRQLDADEFAANPKFGMWQGGGSR